MLRSISKQSGESTESVLKMKKATVPSICRKGRYYAWNEIVGLRGDGQRWDTCTCDFTKALTE